MSVPPAAPALGHPGPRALSPGRIRAERALTVLAAALAGAAVWLAASPLAGVTLAARSGPGGAAQQVGLPSVVLASLLSGLAGWVLLAALERFARRPRVVWTSSALAVLAVSLGGPLSATSAAATATLCCLHVAVGAVLFAGLRRTARR
jgi:uncharacterized protein DUF6069